MHQGVGVVEEADNHKNLGDLGISIAKLLHGSSVKLQSGRTIVQRRHYHSNDFFGACIDAATAHDGFILLPIGLQVCRIVRCSTEVYRHV